MQRTNPKNIEETVVSRRIALSFWSENEKARRKRLPHAVRADARRKVRDSLPVPAPVSKALFDYLDEQPGSHSPPLFTRGGHRKLGSKTTVATAIARLWQC